MAFPHTGLTYFAVLPLAIFLAGRYRIDLLSRRQHTVHLSGAIAFCYVHIVIIAAIPIIRINPDTPFETMLFRQIRGNFAMDFLSYWAVVVTLYAVRYHSELQQREVAAAQLEASLAQAHLQTLQAQLRPHFFFNTLQAISVLALKGDTDGVVETLAHLSNLLRVTFDGQRPHKIPLATEMEFLDEYLAIERLSLGNRLHVVRDIDPDALVALVPSMVLQLLVENAIVHGIAKGSGVGTVRISVTREEGALRLRVANSGPGFLNGAPRQPGIGLANTRSRLAKLYGPAHRIELDPSPEGGAIATIRIPFERPGDGEFGKNMAARAS